MLAALALEASGCNLAPRQEVDECHRLSQALRSENAGLRDQMLVLRSQNQDFSERAVDDARRIAQLETSNEQLETSVQAYQDERTRLETAYKQLRASLPGSLRPISSNQEGGRQLASPKSQARPDRPTETEPRPEHDPDIQQAEASAPVPETAVPAHLSKSTRAATPGFPPGQKDHPITRTTPPRRPTTLDLASPRLA